MVGDWGRGHGNEENIRIYSAEYEPLNRGRGNNRDGLERIEKAGADDGKRTFQNVKIHLTVRRGRIDPDGKRAQYISRLEALFEKLDKFISREDGVEPTRLRAIDCMVHAIRASYTMLRDIDVEYLENEYTRLEEEDRRQKEEFRRLTEEEREAKREDTKLDFNPAPGPP